MDKTAKIVIFRRQLIYDITELTLNYLHDAEPKPLSAINFFQLPQYSK